MEKDYISPENPTRFLGVFFPCKICLIFKTNITHVFAGRTICFSISYNYDYHRN